MSAMTPEELRSTADLASMEGLNEDRLNEALSKRYTSDVIYVSGRARPADAGGNAPCVCVCVCRMCVRVCACVRVLRSEG